MWTGSNPSLPGDSQAAEDDKKRRAAIKAHRLNEEHQRINSNDSLNNRRLE